MPVWATAAKALKPKAKTQAMLWTVLFMILRKSDSVGDECRAPSP